MGVAEEIRGEVAGERLDQRVGVQCRARMVEVDGVY